MSAATIERAPRIAERAVRGAAAFDRRPVGVYGRISKRKKGDGKGATLGIKRQHHDGIDYACRKLFGTDDKAFDRDSLRVVAYADLTSYDVDVVTYRDNMSAWNEDVFREEYEAMLLDLAEGRLRAVVAWHPDRFTRQPAQLEAMFGACKRSAATMHTCITGHIESKLTIRILAAVAAEESDQKSRRITRKHEELAMDGRPQGGRRRFGYSAVGMDVVDDEAAVVRELAARALGGESMASLARWLNDTGVPQALGKVGTWQGSNVSRLLRQPYLAGRRVYKGAPVGDASWKPILDSTTHELLVAKLGDPDRRTNFVAGRVYLLSSLARCTCGEFVKGRVESGARRAGGIRYTCMTERHLYRDAEQVDEAVGMLIVDRLSKTNASGALVDDAAADAAAGLRAELEALDKRYDAEYDRYLDGKVREADWVRTQERTNARRDAIDAELGAAVVAAAAPKVLQGFIGEAAAEAWASADLHRRRAIIDHLCESITLVGAQGTRGKFDPRQHVLVDWRRSL